MQNDSENWIWCRQFQWCLVGKCFPGWNPEIISAEQRCFRDLTFFSADSKNMKNIRGNQCCIRSDQFWFSLNQGCSELKNSAMNNVLSKRTSSKLALFITCRWAYQNVITKSITMKTHEVVVAACLRSQRANVSRGKRHPRSLYELEWDLTNINVFINP